MLHFILGLIMRMYSGHYLYKAKDKSTISTYYSSIQGREWCDLNYGSLPWKQTDNITKLFDKPNLFNVRVLLIILNYELRLIHMHYNDS